MTDDGDEPVLNGEVDFGAFGYVFGEDPGGDDCEFGAAMEESVGTRL